MKDKLHVPVPSPCAAAPPVLFRCPSRSVYRAGVVFYGVLQRIPLLLFRFGDLHVDGFFKVPDHGSPPAVRVLHASRQPDDLAVAGRVCTSRLHGRSALPELQVLHAKQALPGLLPGVHLPGHVPDRGFNPHRAAHSRHFRRRDDPVPRTPFFRPADDALRTDPGLGAVCTVGRGSQFPFPHRHPAYPG